MTYVRNLLLASIVALTALATGCNRDDPSKFIDSGRSYLEKKDYKSAVIELKNAIQAAPEDGEPRYLLALALLETNEARDAEIELRKAADLGFDANLVQPTLARTLIAIGEADNALELTAQAKLTDAKAQARMKAIAGAIMLNKRDLAGGKQAFTDALALDSSNRDAQLGLARLAASESGISEAVAQVDAVLAEHPNFADALLFKSQLLEIQGKGADAIQALGLAADEEPNSIAAHMALIPALLRTGDVAGARKRTDTFKKALRNSIAPLYLDALVLYSEGKMNESREATQNALKYAPDYPPLLVLAGTLEIQARNFVQAEEHLTRATKAAPNSYAQRLLVGALLQSGKPQRAKEVLQPLLKARPDDPGLLSLAAEAAMSEGNYQEATKLYAKAVAVDPKNAVRQTRLGQAYINSGEVEQGIQVLQTVAGSGNNIQADLSLIALHMNRRQPEKAKAVLDALLEKQPENPVVHNMKGLVLQASRDSAGARTSFERALQFQPTFFPAAANLAQMDVREGKPAAALGRYQAILEKDPKQEQTLLATVLLLQQTNAPGEEVEKALNRAIEAHPTSANAHLAKVNYLLGQRKVQEGVTAAQTAVAALPDSVQLLEALGRAQLAAGDANQALGSFGKLAQLQPTATRPLILQAEAYAASKNWGSARGNLEKALSMEPGSRAIMLGLVTMDARAGNIDRAITSARDIQKLYPNDPMGYAAEVDIYAREKRLKDAEATLRAGLQKVPDISLVARLWTLLEQQQRPSEADALVRDWTAKNPKSNALANYIAARFTERGDWKQATHWNRESLKLVPNSPAVMNNLAWSLAQLKDPSALEYGEKALGLAPNSPAVLDTVGWIQLQNGNAQKAVELFQKAYTLAPNQLPIRLHLGEALLKAGNTKEARKHLDEFNKLPESSPMRQEAQKLLENS